MKTYNTNLDSFALLNNGFKKIGEEEKAFYSRLSGMEFARLRLTRPELLLNANNLNYTSTVIGLDEEDNVFYDNDGAFDYKLQVYVKGNFDYVIESTISSDVDDEVFITAIYNPTDGYKIVKIMKQEKQVNRSRRIK